MQGKYGVISIEVPMPMPMSIADIGRQRIKEWLSKATIDERKAFRQQFASGDLYTHYYDLVNGMGESQIDQAMQIISRKGKFNDK